MRKGTKSFISILSLGLVAAGYQAGQSAELPTAFAASPQGGTSTSAGASVGGTSAGSETVNTSVATPAATPAASAAATPGAATSGSTGGTVPATGSTPAATTAAPAPVSTPKATTAAPAPATTPAPATNPGSSTTKTGAAIAYRFGTVQVSVTKAYGKITAVNLLQQGATGGREGAFPYLVQYAVAANGTSFGNLGGATFTTDAFKQSMESALAKF